MRIQGFKPNLIPNKPKTGEFTTEKRNSVIEKNGGIREYIIANKKDGCRLQLGLADSSLTRSLKAPKSNLVLSRFAPLNNLCKELKIAIDGEFYMHGLKFNEIFRFFSNTDVTREEYRIKLQKELKKDPAEFRKDYSGRSIAFLTDFHTDLKFWLFDGIVLDRPDLVGFEERMAEISNRLSQYDIEDSFFLVPFIQHSTRVDTIEEMDYLYENSIESGWEGLVIVHRDHQYKFGRNSLNQGTILKLKDDEREYDGIILAVEEGDQIKEGVGRGQNELGRSTTSKKKEDREPSGKAKGLLVQYEDVGTFVVGLSGFNDAQKKELLDNRASYIGRHFQYTGMPPVKDFPRHAYFSEWRDEK